MNLQELRNRYDAADMLGRIIAFPDQMEAAWSIGEEFARSLTASRSKFERVVVAGMGGSAIGGDLAKSFLGDAAASPIVSCRDYSLPRSVARGALFIASSYSGNTAETLSAYDGAKGNAAAIIAITGGGELAARCQRDRVPCCLIPGGMPPRAAIGLSLLPMLHVLRAAGAASFDDAEYREALATARDVGAEYAPSREANRAAALARELHGKTPFVYAAPALLEGVARRWACQFNENSKTLAHFAFFPELNHNEIVGWEVGAQMAQTVILSLEDRDDHPGTRRHTEIGLTLMQPFAARVERIETPASGRLARMLAMMLLGDFASVYLAYLNGVDPTPVKKIDALKKELSR